jgi:sugar phosphate isomerase/epimerase
MNTESGIGIAVVMEAFLHRSLADTLSWLQQNAPEVTGLEIGSGGYAPHPHCDTDTLLDDASERRRWHDFITGQGFEVSALNCWGNPLHPDPEIARAHDRALRDTIRLATELGMNRIVAMAGCPPATPGDASPHFAGGGWLPYLDGVYDQQWTNAIEPYWSDVAAFAQSVNPDLMICLELHPGTSVYNVDTFERLAALGPAISANLDPSHFMWMGMDAHKVAERIAPRVGHMHGKDTIFHPDQIALNGLLDRRWPQPADQMGWTFGIPGRGHDQAWWTELLRILSTSPARVISIEHEDPFIAPEIGVPEAATMLRRALDDVAMAVA